MRVTIAAMRMMERPARRVLRLVYYIFLDGRNQRARLRGVCRAGQLLVSAVEKARFETSSRRGRAAWRRSSSGRRWRRDRRDRSAAPGTEGDCGSGRFGKFVAASGRPSARNCAAGPGQETWRWRATATDSSGRCASSSRATTITLRTPEREFRYEVQWTAIVPPTAVGVIQPTSERH